MNNCTEYLELISACADDELTESERRRVEEHLSECEACSALLDLYRGISAASVEFCVPAPEALLSGVMEKVLSGQAARSNITAKENIAKDKKAQKAKMIRLAFTHYLPVAACLALVLISLPWIFNNCGNRKSDSLRNAPIMEGSGGAAEPSAMPDAAMPAALPEAAMEAGGGTLSGSDSAERRESGDYAGDGFTSGAPPSTDMPEPGGVFGTQGNENESVSANAAAENQEDDAGWSFDPGYGEIYLLDPDEAGDTLSAFNNACAWIEIYGELPEMLEGYLPEPLGDGCRFDVYYVIPVSVAQELIGVIWARDGVAIITGNQDSDYAIILYSPEG